jgi:hypothetical protein
MTSAILFFGPFRPGYTPGHDQLNYDRIQFVTTRVVDGGECANLCRLVCVAGLTVSVLIEFAASGV